MKGSHKAVDLETYADVLAHLRHFPKDKEAEVLSRFALERPEWEAAAATWTAARDQAMQQGDAELPARFGSAFARARRRLAADRPTLEASRGASAEVTASAPAELELDKYARLSAELSAPQAVRAAVLARHALDEARFERISAGWRGRFQADPRLLRDYELLTSHERSRLAPTSPNGGDLQPVPLAPHVARGLEGQTPLPASPPDLVRIDPAPAPQPPPVIQSPVGSRPSNKSKLERTRDLDAGPMPIPKLPFRPAPPAPVVSSPAPARKRSPDVPTGTRPMMSFPAGPATPFEKGKSAPEMTLEQHAMLCAEIATFPGRTAEILVRYGTDSSTKAVADDYYRRVVEAPSARAAWNEVYSAQCARLQLKGR